MATTGVVVPPFAPAHHPKLAKRRWSLGRVLVSCNAASRKTTSKVPSPRRKDNFWSVDLGDEVSKNRKSGKQTRERDKGKSYKDKSLGNSVVSPMLLVDQEEILQVEEVVPSPLWKTFASNNSGIWKGVGAVFSPDTGDIQPLGLGNGNEYLYDCRIVNFVEIGKDDIVEREVLWNLENKQGEKGKERVQMQDELLAQDILEEEEVLNNEDEEKLVNYDSFEEFEEETDDEVQNLEVEDSLEDENESGCTSASTEEPSSTDEVVLELKSKHSYEGMKEAMEKDVMHKERGLVFFEDGAYSRGPLNLLRSKDDKTIASGYFYTPIVKIEQCIVRGGHKRVRIVHTVSVDSETEEVQVVRLGVYEEEWLSPIREAQALRETSKDELMLLSQRPRTSPRDLTGKWKAFEKIAFVQPEIEDNSEDSTGMVYTCREVQRRRRLPREEEEEEVVWLPGGYFSYVHVDKDGKLRLGAGWFCSRSKTSLSMDRSYDSQGKLAEVKFYSEIKS